MLNQKEKIFTKDNKVLFIIHDLYQEDNEFPLGIGYLSAILNNAGAEVETYCMDVFHHSIEDLIEHLEKNKYDLIGVGFLAARFKETVEELCNEINKHKKDAWLVLGGPGPSPIPEHILKTTNVDVVVIGEAEYTILDLLKSKITDKKLSEVKGIAYLYNNELKSTPRNQIVHNLDEVPFPLWEIFPMEKYTTCLDTFNQEPHERALDIITSRGCINRCNFCYRMEEGIRIRRIENIIEELKILKEKYNVSCYVFQDELFVLSKSRLLQFEKALKENNLKIKFSCNARVDIIDEELVKILKNCGCQFINIGFESSSNKVLKLMNKNTTVEQNIHALEIIKKAGGIGMGLNFIWNNLGDDENSLKENVKLIKKYNTYYHCRTIRPVTPYPGSDLYYHAIKTGKLKGPEDFFNKFKNSDLITVNFMDMPDARTYELLLEANTELILDHYQHTSGDMKEAERLIQQFKDLYSGKELKFREARHYSKEKD